MQAVKSHEWTPINTNKGIVGCLPVCGSGEVVRFVARFPFDIAADAGLLICRDRFGGEDCFKGATQIFSSDGDAVARTAVIELAAIAQALVAIEQVNVR